MNCNRIFSFIFLYAVSIPLVSLCADRKTERELPAIPSLATIHEESGRTLSIDQNAEVAQYLKRKFFSAHPNSRCDKLFEKSLGELQKRDPIKHGQICHAGLPMTGLPMTGLPMRRAHRPTQAPSQVIHAPSSSDDLVHQFVIDTLERNRHERELARKAAEVKHKKAKRDCCKATTVAILGALGTVAGPIITYYFSNTCK